MLGIAAPIAAWQAYRARQELKQEKARQNAKVTVVLKSESGLQYVLPVPVRRADLTRGEIMGRLGMIPMKPVGDNKHPKFKLAFTNTPVFLEQIAQVIEGDDHATLTFTCTDEEFEQFAVQVMLFQRK